MKNIILFDIDSTLFNTNFFKETYREKISAFLNTTLEQFKIVEEEYIKKQSSSTDFNPKEFLSHISKRYGVSTEDLGKIFFDKENFESTLYPDTSILLRSLCDSYKLGIFSEGLNDYQLLKLHNSVLLQYFDQDITFIFKRKLTQESLDSLPKGCFIVDDNRFVIDALCETGLFKPIWLNRKTRERHDVCETINDLSQLRGVLKKP